MASQPGPLVASTAVRGLSAGAFVSLLAASAALVLLAFRVPSPAPTLFIASITAVLAFTALFSGDLVLKGKRHQAIFMLTFAIAFIAIVTTIRFLPGLFRATYNLDVEALFPPLWPYSAAVPLMLLLLLDVALPSRRQGRVPLVVTALPVLASMMVLYFGSSFIAGLSYGFLRLPVLIFNALASCLALSSLLIVGAVLPRKGLVKEGGIVLMAAGFLLEVMSILFYQTLPSFTEIFEGALLVERLQPLVPVVGGTVPGALSAIAGALLLIKALISPEPENLPSAQGPVPAEPEA